MLRNSLIPIVSLFGLDFAAVIGGGAILTETVFELHGVGQYSAQSIRSLDLPPILGVALFSSFFIVLFQTSSTSSTPASTRGSSPREQRDATQRPTESRSSRSATCRSSSPPRTASSRPSTA